MRVLWRMFYRAVAIALMAMALGWLAGSILIQVFGWEPVSWKV